MNVRRADVEFGWRQARLVMLKAWTDDDKESREARWTWCGAYIYNWNECKRTLVTIVFLQ